MNRLWLLPTLLSTACSFDASGLLAPDGSPDVTVTDLRTADLRSADHVTLPDASLDLADSTIPDAPDPCIPNPCQNGGTCARGTGGPVCQCAKGFDGPVCSKCALGHAGASCAACPRTKRTIQSCSHASINCKEWIDGNNKTATNDKCPTGASGCFKTDIDFDLGSRQFVHRLRFLSDWYNKRPETWEIWASDDNVNFSLVMTAHSNKAHWKCVPNEPCTAEVPTECCPGGKTQDITSVGTIYPKWDDFRFSGVTARYWRFRITKTFVPYLIMRELELYGHDCLGDLACATSKCGKGVCTGQEKAFCTCAGCKAPAACTSAFTSVAPACTTP